MITSSLSWTVAAGAVLIFACAAGTHVKAADPLIEACLSQLNLTETVCDCIASSADEELSEIQRRYVVAELNGDQATTSQLEDEMTDQDVFDVGDWMDNAPAKCEFD